MILSLWCSIPFILFIHCTFIFIFKKWFGPLVTFYSSLLIYTLLLLLLVIELYYLFSLQIMFYIDFGRLLFLFDILDSHIVFCFDTLAAIAAFLVALLTVFALFFGVEYMYREAFINRLLYLLNMFATSVIFFFFSYDFFLILLFWECIGLFSFLLVNFYSTRIYTIKAALKTFVFSRISDFFLFIVFILTLLVFNTTDLTLIFLQVPYLLFFYITVSPYSIHFISLYAICLIFSGLIKAAQFFFHVWLPDAMEAPTPASALIHSSTLVVAGIFLIIRFSIFFDFTLVTNYILIVWGGLTIAFGALTGLFQNDIKKLVAYSTISQIGYLTCGCGFGCYNEVLIYLIIHAINKAFLFIIVGYTVHFFNGNTDLRQMGGAQLYASDLAIFFFIISLNLAGLPYTAGFLAKEFLLFQILLDDFIVYYVRGCWLLSFIATPTYMLLLVFNVFFNFKRSYFKTYFFMNVSYIKSFINIYKKTENAAYVTSLYWSYTFVTARITTIVLTLFLSNILFLWDFLLLIAFDIMSPLTFINAHFFISLTNHSVLNEPIINFYLIKLITQFVLMSTIWSNLFLITIRLRTSYLTIRSIGYIIGLNVFIVVWLLDISIFFYFIAVLIYIILRKYLM